MPIQKTSDQLLILVNLYQHAKNQFAHPSDTEIFRVPLPDWPHPFLTIPVPKSFNHHFNFDHAQPNPFPITYFL